MNTFQGSSNYVASEDLMRSMNIAMALQKPLLIKGEPGTGKTMLAEAVSQALGKKLVTGISNPPQKPRMACMFMTLYNVCMTASLAMAVRRYCKIC